MARNPFWMAGYSQALGQLSEAFRDVQAGQDEQPGRRPICQKNFTAIHEQMHKEASGRIEAAGMSNDDAGAAWIMQTQALRL